MYKIMGSLGYDRNIKIGVLEWDRYILMGSLG